MADPDIQRRILSLEIRQQIAARLQEVGAITSCPRCHTNEWELLPAFVSLALQNDLQNLQLGGEALPLVGVICKQCAYVSLHAAIALGIELPGDKRP